MPRTMHLLRAIALLLAMAHAVSAQQIKCEWFSPCIRPPCQGVNLPSESNYNPHLVCKENTYCGACECKCCIKPDGPCGGATRCCEGSVCSKTLLCVPSPTG
ncbi:hypothetical protein V8C86DRAFT_2919853 [Haematococcus lacustris]